MSTPTLSPFYINAQEQDVSCCEHVCPKCELLEQYKVLIANVEDEHELERWISELIDEAYKLGVRETTLADIDAKIDLLDTLDDECDCDDCHEIE
jgi:hypothetical protein